MALIDTIMALDMAGLAEESVACVVVSADGVNTYGMDYASIDGPFVAFPCGAGGGGGAGSGQLARTYPPLLRVYPAMVRVFPR